MMISKEQRETLLEWLGWVPMNDRKLHWLNQEKIGFHIDKCPTFDNANDAVKLLERYQRKYPESLCGSDLLRGKWEARISRDHCIDLIPLTGPNTLKHTLFCSNASTRHEAEADVILQAIKDEQAT